MGGAAAARRKEVQALFMVDPVDSGPRPGYPSAVAALAAAGRRYGLVGAGRTNACNPNGTNYKAGAPFIVPPDSARCHRVHLTDKAEEHLRRL